MVDRVREAELRAQGAGAVLYRGNAANAVRPTVWLTSARFAEWLSENMVRKPAARSVGVRGIGSLMTPHLPLM